MIISKLRNLIVVIITITITVAKSDARIFENDLNYDAVVDLNKLPTPNNVVLLLKEDKYDDYLDYWLYQKQMNELQIQERYKRDGCVIQIKSLTEPIPIYATDGALLQADGTTGNIFLNPSDIIEASCPGNDNGLVHPLSKLNPNYATFSCDSGSSVKSSWIPEPIEFNEIHCLNRTTSKTIKLNEECGDGGIYINSTLIVGSQYFTVFRSCFHETRYEVLYVEYEQNPENVYVQPKVGRPKFNQGTHFPNIIVDQLYKRISQIKVFDEILGSSMSERYLNSSFFLARGHLAAKTDFVFGPEQRSTFTFVNVAPQWQSFNGGNWNAMEQNLKSKIASSGYRTKIYTGTWDVLKLSDCSGILRNIYLNPGTRQIPVPLWFYKVVYEPNIKKGIVFLGLNNPFITLEEAQELVFCTDICSGNPKFSWLRWRPADVKRGFSICCEIDDFRDTIKILPSFETEDILFQ